METHESTTAHFARHYRQLELDDDADWNSARANYRRLVHLWHPDRFTERPRERANAQQEFIKLTKSHNVLRNFYRKNRRMPFQVASAAGAQHSASSHDDTKTNEDLVDDASVMDSSILKRDATQRRQTMVQSRSLKKATWLASGVCILLGTVMFFLILDRNANRAIAEKGREIVKDAPPSDFLPSASEIRRSQTRGAFVKPTQ